MSHAASTPSALAEVEERLMAAVAERETARAHTSAEAPASR